MMGRCLGTFMNEISFYDSWVPEMELYKSLHAKILVGASSTAPCAWWALNLTQPAVISS